MNSMIIGMLADTPIHPGSGRSTGFVDLPVARESITEYPVIVGSSLKGAWRDRARQKWPNPEKDVLSKEVAVAFGKQDDAGDLIVSDAKLLLLPVRCLTGHYRWATCPYLLERLKRDVERSGVKLPVPEISKKLAEGTALASGNGYLFLEEREFKIGGQVDKGVADAVSQLILYQAAAGRLAEQMVVLSNNDFKWFASYGLPINARNVLNEETKTSENLWYEETLPQDCLFYTVFMERKSGALELVKTLIRERTYLQAGGNETVGQGWFALKVLEG